MGRQNRPFSQDWIAPKIAVVGSLHMDFIVQVKAIPRVGETVLGSSFTRSPGGKGANQAVAAAKLGAAVVLIGRVGADAVGRELIETVQAQGVDATYVWADEGTYTGLALILVDDAGQNIIAVASGADMTCSAADITRAAGAITASHVLLTQLEIPLPVVESALEVAYRHGVPVILNPAPAPGHDLADDLLTKVYLLTPNETEAEVLSGIPIRDVRTAERAAERLLDRGVDNVVLTLGRAGALLATRHTTVHIPGVAVHAIDTTGAGDAFCGALAVAIAAGTDLRAAVTYANYAGALTTTKMGAQAALPTREELERFLHATL
jgi:ribokinase